jgi:hypothetical protein
MKDTKKAIRYQDAGALFFFVRFVSFVVKN